jgi:hypothetical protein
LLCHIASSVAKMMTAVAWFGKRLAGEGRAVMLVGQIGA